jgi:hypothetical protein
VQVGEPGPGQRRRWVEPLAVIAHDDLELMVVLLETHGDAGRVRMLDRVGGRLGDQEVRIRLELHREARKRLGDDRDLDRRSRPACKAEQRAGQPTVTQDRRVDPLCGLTESAEDGVGLRGQLVHDLVHGLRILTDALLGEPEVQTQHDHLLLNPVVQVAGEPPARLVLCPHDAASRPLEGIRLPSDEIEL